MTILPSQSRASRELIRWSQKQLADAAGLSLSTIRNFETGWRSPLPENLSSIRRALEAEGIEFYDDQSRRGGIGVILRTKSRNSFRKERADERCLLLHGTILKAYSAMEFALIDLCQKSLHTKDYKNVSLRRASTFLADIKVIRKLIARPGPLKHYSAPLQRLLDEAVRLFELRNFIVHGTSAVSETKVAYKRHRDHSDGEGISEIEIDFGQLQKTADQIERISIELNELIATISKDRRFLTT
jgi:transcriptional regulator with XRE-family HTH domain